MKSIGISPRRAICAFLIILAGVFILLSGIPVTYMDNDEAYQALSAISYRTSPLAMLTFAAGHLWMNIFGDSLFSLRFLAFLCYLFAIGAGSIYLFRKTKDPLTASIVFLICCLAANIGGFRIYNWDTGAYPSEVLGILSFFLFINHPSARRAALCGAAVGLMTLYRIPLICFFFIIILLSFLATDKETRHSGKPFVWILSAGAATLVMILVGGTLMCGSPAAYLSAFNSDNIITGHTSDGIARKIWNYKTITPRVTMNWFPLIVAFLCSMLYAAARRHRRSIAVLGLAICAVISWANVKLHGQVCLFADPWFTIGLPLCLIAAFYPFFSNYISPADSPSRFPRKVVLKGICVGLVPLFIALGSDTTIERLNASFSIPFALGIVLPACSDKIKRLGGVWLRYSLFSLSVLWVFMMWHTLKEAKPIDPPIPYHQYTFMRKIDTDMFHGMQEDIEKFKPGTEYAFWGGNRYMFLYTFGRSSAFPLQKFHVKDQPEKEFTSNIHKLDYLFMVFPPDNPNAEMKELNRYLQQHSDFEFIKRGNCYTLYKRKETCSKDTVR